MFNCSLDGRLADEGAAPPGLPHQYDHHRHHTAIGGPPIGRCANLTGQNG